jgi:hypothetical protein
MYIILVITALFIVYKLANWVNLLGKRNYLKNKGWDRQVRALAIWARFVDCYKKDNMFLDLQSAIRKQKELDGGI